MQPWHQSAEAAAILATLAANPPAKRTAHYAFGESEVRYTDQNGDGTVREGRPVRTLQKLYRDFGDTVTGDDWIRWAQDSIHAAIDRAIAEHVEALGLRDAA